MITQSEVAAGALGLGLLALVIERLRARARRDRRQRARRAKPRRQQYLEHKMVTAAFLGPRETYGEIFAEFSIWRVLDDMRMDVTTKGPWERLNRFTRSLIVRHLWQSLEALTDATVVVTVDAGTPDSMIWTASHTNEFNDCGLRPPWVSKKGRVGTMLSGPDADRSAAP